MARSSPIWGSQTAPRWPPTRKYRETWRLRNTAGVPGPRERSWCSFRDPIPGPQRAPRLKVGPGRDVDVTVSSSTDAAGPVRELLASPGPWRALFGAVVYTEIMVSSDAAPVSIPEVGPRPSPTRWPDRAAGDIQRTLPPPPCRQPKRPLRQVCQLPTRHPAMVPAERLIRGSGRWCDRRTPWASVCPASHQPQPGPSQRNRGIFQVFWQEIDGSDPAVRLELS